MIKVSVLIITFNQEKFIAQAIESALMQQTHFPYEIVIGDDCSQDNTQEIIKHFQQQHPAKVRLLLHNQNVGMNHNLVQTLQACQGEYVALLEGDDYWTSPDKLQSQVDFLDQHSSCALCFHTVRVINEEGNAPDALFPLQCKQFSNIEDLLRQNFIQTNSVMFRRETVSHFPDWFYEAKLGDWPLCLFHASHGKIGYLDKVMAVYRKHSGGVWSNQTREYQMRETMSLYKHINTYFGFRYGPIIREMTAKFLYELIFVHQQQGDLSSARRCAWQYARMDWRGAAMKVPAINRTLLRLYVVPFVRKLVRKLGQAVKHKS